MSAIETDPPALLAARLVERLGPAGLVLATNGEARAGEVARAARALAPACSVVSLPGWDCLPFDRVSPVASAMGARMAALHALAAAGPHLLVTPADALAQRLPPPTEAKPLVLRVGDSLEPDGLRAALRRFGYEIEERADAPGEVALHGAVLDIFPAAEPRPGRLRLEAGRIAEIDRYDPLTQRTRRHVEQLVVGPASEIVGDVQRKAGIEHGLASHYPALVSVFDLLPRADLLFEPEALDLLLGRLETVRESGGRGLYLDPAKWQSVQRQRPPVLLEECDAAESLPPFAASPDPGRALAEFVAAQLRHGRRVGLAGRRLAAWAEETLEEATERVEGWSGLLTMPAASVGLLAASPEAGFLAPEAALVAERDLFPPAAGDGLLRPSPPMPGDAVVDVDHGLAALRGLEKVEAEGIATDCLALEFAAGRRLLVPVEEAGRIWRYGADAAATPLDRLEDAAWRERRAAIEAEISKAAGALLEAERARAAMNAPAIRPTAGRMARFAAGFPYAPTRDQAAAIAATLADLRSGRAMDRLVCGDVGFGKTEVALRAAAAAALAGKQVAVVAPTTVLARQHAATFRRRFAPLGITVGALSRLTPPAEARQVKAGLGDGTLRVVVGTQALAGKGVRFADLGLMVIDEEQRFGARQKAMLRRLRPQGVHALTLTATPIPRTLQAALVGAQELSVLATPPTQRQPVRTVVMNFDAEQVRSALERERRRGGQAFFVCPRIEDLPEAEAVLRSLLPGLDVVVAHGGLAPAELDEAMVRFADGGGDVLLSTSIVESGLDIPRANTMLVWRADRFGLAQLHQLRGRVGRGGRRGAVWLFTDPEAPPGAAARRRLETLAENTSPGAGFAVAARDLDIRGAGDLVGEEQAGHMRRIGLDLYRALLGRALRAARGEAVEDPAPPVLRLGVPMTIPADYVSEEAARIELHLRLAHGADPEALAEEAEDRFGPPPAELDWLLAAARLRATCRRLGVAELEVGPAGAKARLAQGTRLVLRQVAENPAARLRNAAALLRAIARREAEAEEAVA